MAGGFALGEARPPKPEDFSNFKAFAQDTNGWEQHYPRKSKSGSTKAYTRLLEGTNVRAVKVNCYSWKLTK